EGTIDSELFGHEKGSFTGAHDTRKGYFETVNGGTIFLDEVGELPLDTQARLLRVLETGEFIKVGSSKVQKTDVRVVAATNRDLLERAEQGKFREDLYYRLSTVPIRVPALKERKEDIYLLFRKFATVYAEKYHTLPVELEVEAQQVLENYRWPGNVRQLKNMVEQISVLEGDNKRLSASDLLKYIPNEGSSLPAISKKDDGGFSERDIFYKVLFDLRNDVSDLKQVVIKLIENGGAQQDFIENNEELLAKVLDYNENQVSPSPAASNPVVIRPNPVAQDHDIHEVYVEAQEAHEDENLSLEDKEREMIRKALLKHRGRRKRAATELGISERTLYRKIKQYELEEI
ncbi:MAG: sigma 54-interacting transcriptional regulator, partial [Bacteroidota bacterium]|nr:sigma 54-interacting transcriptional regulator [Bacteroidota bacterium]MDX5430023.1 sigma 54-interacting transcriptional regulator [Bacteroidota bacterium]MDX5468793.1 sigma 54-interacting transcriptional regulator [Bacteroidota bacterium]